MTLLEQVARVKVALLPLVNEDMDADMRDAWLTDLAQAAITAHDTALAEENAALAKELQEIRDGVDAFNPDARMAACSAFDAAERVWKLVPKIIEALTARAALEQGK